MACLDDAGDEWVNSTLVCLQRMLVPLVEEDPEELSCRSIKTFAFDTHPLCYTGGGGSQPTDPSVCFLSPSDWGCIIGTVDTIDLLSPLGIQQEVAIVDICAQQLAAAGVCSTEKIVAGDASYEDPRCEYWLNRVKKIQ